MEIKTRFSKNHYGYNACTILHAVKGQSYEIFTMRRYSGKLVSCCTAVTISDNFTSHDWDAECRYITHSNVKRCTQKAVKQAHVKAVGEFMEQLKMKVNP